MSEVLFSDIFTNESYRFRLGIPYPKWLGLEELNIRFLDILEFMHTPNETSWEWDPSLKTTYLYLHIPLMHIT